MAASSVKPVYIMVHLKLLNGTLYNIPNTMDGPGPIAFREESCNKRIIFSVTESTQTVQKS